MRVNIYIRKDNEDYWNAIPDKSAWVNTLLSTTIPREPQPESLLEQAITAFQGDPTPAEGKTCKNGHAVPKGRDRCLTKGCKYS